MSLQDATSLQRWSRLLKSWLTQPRLRFFLAVFLLAQVGMFLYLQSRSGMLDRSDRVRGKDFFIIYLASYLVQNGEAHRLYDQQYFLEVEGKFVEFTDLVPRNPSVYPPNAAYFFAYMGKMPYDQAVIAWWLQQLLCFILAGVLLYRDFTPQPEWKWTAILGYAAFYPLLATFQHGQFAALLMLSLCLGTHLHRRGMPIWAGVAWSLLAIKPQLGLGLGVWLLMRLEWKAILGLCLGGLAQLLITVNGIGFEPFIQYLHNFKMIGEWTRLFSFAPDHQHALSGSLAPFLPQDARRWADALHLIIIAVCTFWLFRMVRHSANGAWQLAMALVYTVFVVPHLLTYDLVYLLIPVAVLLNQAPTREEALLPAALIYGFAMLAPLYALTGISLVPWALILAMWLMYKISVTTTAELGSE